MAEGYGPAIEEFACRHPEIRIVLSGNRHMREKDNVPRELETGGYWLNTFFYGKYLAVLNVSPRRRSKEFTYAGYNIPILSTYEPDPAVYSLIKDDLHSKFEEIFREQSFEYKAANIIPPEECKDCHAHQYEVFAQSGHPNSLKTLKDAGQQYTIECLSGHVGYSASPATRNLRPSTASNARRESPRTYSRQRKPPTSFAPGATIRRIPRASRRTSRSTSTQSGTGIELEAARNGMMTSIRNQRDHAGGCREEQD